MVFPIREGPYTTRDFLRSAYRSQTMNLRTEARIGGIKFLPAYKFWLGHQKQFYVTDKYKGKKLVHWARPSIWLSNSDPRDELGVDTDWLNANCDFVYLDSPIVMN